MTKVTPKGNRKKEEKEVVTDKIGEQTGDIRQLGEERRGREGTRNRNMLSSRQEIPTSSPCLPGYISLSQATFSSNSCSRSLTLQTPWMEAPPLLYPLSALQHYGTVSPAWPRINFQQLTAGCELQALQLLHFCGKVTFMPVCHKFRAL